MKKFNEFSIMLRLPFGFPFGREHFVVPRASVSKYCRPAGLSRKAIAIWSICSICSCSPIVMQLADSPDIP